MRNLLKAPWLLALLATSGWCQNKLAEASLEQLLNTEVTSVSKKEQKLSRTAAAVFVIGQDDIRRSGATSLPDLLRMAPGVDVAQIDANAWAITIRGFNSRYSNKVLVLIDGRSVYTPSFSGVDWDHLDMPLEDIERIEVIRGPGASVWGANAVNGVINIITKNAKATRGGLVSAAADSHGGTDGLVRYGGVVPAGSGDGAAWRAFAKYSRIAGMPLPDGSPGGDAWSRVHGGFRSDWDISPYDSLTLEGDLFSNDSGQSRHRWFYPTNFDPPFRQDVDAAGGSLLARWDHTFAGGANTSLQAYYDTYRRNDMGEPEIQRTMDLDFQDHFAAGDRHDIVWGLGARSLTSGLPPGYEVALTPPIKTVPLFSAFFQDEVRVAHALWLTLGSKVEHNAYTGFEYEPNVRLAWAPTYRQTFWAAASRAIRQPSREETGVDIDLLELPVAPGLLAVTRLQGNPHIQSEELRDYEAGYRTQWTRRVSLDLTTFLSFYRHLGTEETAAPVFVPGLPPHLDIALTVGNKGRSVNYGGEAALNLSVTSRWRISPSYSQLHINFRVDPSSTDQQGFVLAEDAPRHMFQIRSFWNVSRKLEWDHTLYWAQSLPHETIPSHARLDSRIAWKVGERTEIGVVGQNLLRPRFREFEETFQIAGTEVERSVYGKITWTF
ncbi:MAG: TonB-dependent receptor plug domain-containing protein [Acidobacteriia bacterium]|nr:TonB-dependent receptor plug domain-containing protein [Terriglobia bacterium]